MKKSRVAMVSALSAVLMSTSAVSYAIAQESSSPSSPSSTQSSEKRGENKESPSETSKEDKGEEDKNIAGEFGSSKLYMYVSGSDEYIHPPVNPVLNYYSMYKPSQPGMGELGIAPPVNPLPHFTEDKK